MILSDVVFEMELNGVDNGVISSIVEICKEKGIILDLIDEELIHRGYQKIFTVGYGYNDDWEDDEHLYDQKIVQRRNFLE